MPPLLWAEFSIQFLLPALFLVIWALNQVFGRAEAPQPPIRERVGPRPVPPPTGPSRAPQTPSRAPRGNTPDRSRTSPNRGPNQGRVRDSSRVPGRSKAPEESVVAPPPNRVGDSHRTPRPIPKDVQDVYAIYDDQRMDSAEIQRGLGPISADVTHSAHTQGLDLPIGLSAWTNLAEKRIAPSQLREAIILSEILSPPSSVRRLREVRSMAMASIAAEAEAASGAEPGKVVEDEARES